MKQFIDVATKEVTAPTTGKRTATLLLLLLLSGVNSRNGFKDDDFIFCDEKGRTNSRSLDNLIRKCCKRAGIEIKSIHDIRRTNASQMFNNNVPAEVIQTLLGHSDIKTTYGYIYDNVSKKERQKMVINSISGLNAF